MGGGITQGIGAAIGSQGESRGALRGHLAPSDGDQRVGSGRRSVRGPVAARRVVLPRDFVFGPEGAGGGSRAALRGGEGGGVDPAVGGGALQEAVELEITANPRPRAHLVPPLVAVGRAGGVAGESVAARLAG